MPALWPARCWAFTRLTYANRVAAAETTVAIWEKLADPDRIERYQKLAAAAEATLAEIEKKLANTKAGAAEDREARKGLEATVKDLRTVLRAKTVVPPTVRARRPTPGPPGPPSFEDTRTKALQALKAMREKKAIMDALFPPKTDPTL